jgi:hypothetical protein
MHEKTTTKFEIQTEETERTWGVLVHFCDRVKVKLRLSCQLEVPVVKINLGS